MDYGGSHDGDMSRPAASRDSEFTVRPIGLATALQVIVGTAQADTSSDNILVDPVLVVPAATFVDGSATLGATDTLVRLLIAAPPAFDAASVDATVRAERHRTPTYHC